MTWLEDLLPPPEKLDSWQQHALELKNKVSQFEFDPRIKELTKMKYEDIRAWFDERLEGAISATAEGSKDFDKDRKLELFNYTIIQYR